MQSQKIESPHKKWFNARWLLVPRSTIANNTRDAYNEIAPGFLFGAAPSQKTLATITDRDKLVRVSLLDNDEENILKPKDEKNEPIRLSTFDHSTLNPNTGKHTTVKEMRGLVSAVTAERAKENTVYVHCLAGRSRSMEAVISCLYLDPEWLKKARISDSKKGILQDDPDLNKRLADPYGPLPSDIAEYVKLKRQEATKFNKLGADRTGFLGLMTLSEETRKLRETPALITKIPDDRLEKVAQNIGLMLQAPLDRGFRNEEDVKQQEIDLAEMQKKYADKGMNLLEQMLVPIGKKDMGYKENFEALSPSAKARFSILAAKVGADASKLPAPYSTPELCALLALTDYKKLSVGDQVELLREFSNEKYFKLVSPITFESVANRIVSGSKLDRYHAGIQLAELLSVGKHDPNNKKTIDQAFNKLSRKEQSNFIVQLYKSNDPSAANQYTKSFSENHKITSNELEKFTKAAKENKAAHPPEKPQPQLRTPTWISAVPKALEEKPEQQQAPEQRPRAMTI